MTRRQERSDDAVHTARVRVHMSTFYLKCCTVLDTHACDGPPTPTTRERPRDSGRVDASLYPLSGLRGRSTPRPLSSLDTHALLSPALFLKTEEIYAETSDGVRMNVERARARARAYRYTVTGHPRASTHTARERPLLWGWHHERIQDGTTRGAPQYHASRRAATRRAMRRECVEVSSRSASSSSVARWRRLAKSACGRKGRGAPRCWEGAREGAREGGRGRMRDGEVRGAREGRGRRCGERAPAAGALLAARRSLSPPRCADGGGSSAAARPPARAGQRAAPAAATPGCGTRAGRARASRPARARQPPHRRSSAAQRAPRVATAARRHQAPARPAFVLVRTVAVQA